MPSIRTRSGLTAQRASDIQGLDGPPPRRPARPVPGDPVGPFSIGLAVRADPRARLPGPSSGRGPGAGRQVGHRRLAGQPELGLGRLARPGAADDQCAVRPGGPAEAQSRRRASQLRTGRIAAGDQLAVLAGHDAPQLAAAGQFLLRADPVIGSTSPRRSSACRRDRPLAGARAGPGWPAGRAARCHTARYQVAGSGTWPGPAASSRRRAVRAR